MPASVVVAVRFFVQPLDADWWSSSAQLTRIAVFLLENLTIAGLAWKYRRQQQRILEVRQLRAVHVTARTLQDTIANSLNQRQLLRLNAEGLVPQESVDLFDRTVQDIARELRNIGNLQTYAERPTPFGIELVTDRSSAGTE